MITVVFGTSQLEGDWGPGCGYGIAGWGGMPMGIPGWPPGAPVGQSQFRLALWITLSTRSASSLTYSIKDINIIDLQCWTNRFKFQTISSTEKYAKIHEYSYILQSMHHGQRMQRVACHSLSIKTAIRSDFKGLLTEAAQASTQDVCKPRSMSSSVFEKVCARRGLSRKKRTRELSCSAGAGSQQNARDVIG